MRGTRPLGVSTPSSTFSMVPVSVMAVMWPSSKVKWSSRASGQGSMPKSPTVTAFGFPGSSCHCPVSSRYVLPPKPR